MRRLALLFASVLIAACGQSPGAAVLPSSTQPQSPPSTIAPPLVPTIEPTVVPTATRAVAPTASPTASPQPSPTIRPLTPTIPAPPRNDAPPGVAITQLPFTDLVNVDRAQIHAMEGAGSCGGGSKSVWYSYTATDAGVVVADTFGSDYDTVLDIWRGALTSDYLNPGFETLVPLACNDDADMTAQSVVVFATEAGQGYVIRVLAKEGFGGNLRFSLSRR